MSVPARKLPASPPAAAAVARRPAARLNPGSDRGARARRGSTPAFWFLSAVLVSALVFAVVGLNALVVNTTYRTTDAQDRLRALQEQHEQLGVEVARLSSPSRIAEWADVVGMVAPGAGESVILRVPAEPSGSDGGEAAATHEAGA